MNQIPQDRTTPFHRRGHLIEDIKVPTGTHAHVLQILNLYTHDKAGKNQGYAWPSIYTLAKAVMVSENRVKHILKDLCNIGLVERSKLKSDPGKQQNRNKYMLTLEK